ncbi:MAG: hypothetical protein C0600_01095 [Ignavibacteria bacterium]|nr:MAG: hypothetical protein C0600_01095 [Ignavibacteria bacterium]
MLNPTTTPTLKANGFRQYRYLFCSLLVILLAFAACRDDPEGPVAPSAPGNGSSNALTKGDGSIDVTDRYIVIFKDFVENPEAITKRLAKSSGVKIHHRYRFAIKGFAATIPAQALNGIRHNPNVDYIEADGIATSNGIQSNPPNWGLDRIDQYGPLYGILYNDLYIYPNDGSDVTVYIIDSGIRFDHQEFGSRASSGYDFIDRDNDASDYCNGHGTHVAGIVGGTNVGVAKNVDLVAVRVLDCSGSGRWSQVLAGIDWVKQNHSGPSVANMSLGGLYRKSVNTAVDNSVAAGIVYCVSSGNDGANACDYSPASAASAITVASTWEGDALAGSSNTGPCVDIFAPGVSIYSSTSSTTSSYATWSGTSMASPHVAGVAALYLSANPNATPAQVTTAILTGATQGAVHYLPNDGSPNLLLYAWIVASPVNAPAAPANLAAASTTPGQVDLSWTDNATNEVGYIVNRRRNNQPWRYIETLGANATSYSNTGLDGGTFYYYRVHAYNSGGYSDNCDHDTVTVAYPPHTSSPSAPSNLRTIVVQPEFISIGWDDNSDNEDGFRVERSLDGGATWTEIATVGANWSNYRNSGLSPATQYWYRVRAYNSVGTSAYSNTASATTPAAPTDVDVYSVADNATKQGSNWFGNLTVTVRDANNQPASGVTVEVAWSGGASGSGTAVTNSSGLCTVSTDRLGKSISSVSMSVTNLSGSGYSYDPTIFTAATSATVYRP